MAYCWSKRRQKTKIRRKTPKPPLCSPESHFLGMRGKTEAQVLARLQTRPEPWNSHLSTAASWQTLWTERLKNFSSFSHTVQLPKFTRQTKKQHELIGDRNIDFKRTVFKMIQIKNWIYCFHSKMQIKLKKKINELKAYFIKYTMVIILTELQICQFILNNKLLLLLSQTYEFIS